MVRAVIDTNVIVSGILKPGNPRKIWFEFKSGKYNFVLSASMFRELSDVLRRTKFCNLINAEEVKDLLLYLELRAEFIEPKRPVNICRDPADGHILSCAVDANVDFIVSGDKDLLVLNPFQGIPIVSPKEFLAKFRAVS